MAELNLIDDLAELERARFSVNDYRGLPDAPEFELVEGSIPVMVSAPHAVTLLRDGRVKPSEDYTGPIALELARTTGAHAIVATRFHESDPNWNALAHSVYKQAIVTHVRKHGIGLLLDIHGMVAASRAGVAIGTGDGATTASMPGIDKAIFDILSQSLEPYTEKYGKPVVLNGRYAARGENTICSTIVRECGIACVQIELATPYRLAKSLGLGRPEGEKNPFSESQISQELAIRRNPDQECVEATFDALCAIIDLAHEKG